MRYTECGRYYAFPIHIDEGKERIKQIDELYTDMYVHTIFALDTELNLHK